MCRAPPLSSEHDPFVPNRYNLRILSTGDAEAIASELTWLTALSREAGLPVPEPVPTLDGRLLTTITTPGVPRGRHVSLMRWVDGHHLNKGLRPHHARAWGRLVARLHQFSAGWQPPQGFNRRIGTGPDSWAGETLTIRLQSWWRRCPNVTRSLSKQCRSRRAW